MIGLACLVPLTAGGSGMLLSTRMLDISTPADMLSHYRYLSGLLFAIGLGFASCIPAIEAKTSRIQLLTVIVIIGGIGRLLHFMMLDGNPGSAMNAALGMELVVTPLLCLWQRRIAKRYTNKT